MAGTINKVILIGHTGDEVKMHYFEGGGCIGRFPLATNEEYTNRTTGERVSNTEWHNIVVRNKAAEVFEKYLHKGDKVYIEGRLKTRKWTDDQGRDRYSTEIQCIDFTFLSAKGEQAVHPNAPAQGTPHQPSENTASQATQQTTQQEPNTANTPEDDLPL